MDVCAILTLNNEFYLSLNVNDKLTMSVYELSALKLALATRGI